jgi:type II secretory pathway component PulK
MGPRPDPERGFALMLVLLLSLILLPFAASFTNQVQYEAKTALNVSEQLVIENAIDGQFEIMLARLRFDTEQSEVDSYDDVWNDPDLLARKEEDVDVALTTHVWDEQGKLNIRLLGEGAPERRQLMRRRLERLLVRYRRDTPLELSAGDAESWAEAIAEYMSGGAARANIPSPRMIDERPILVLEELKFLPKIRDNDIDFLLHDQLEDDEVVPGLHRFITIYGDGKLNLNTTSLEVLEAVFGENPELGERIIQRREDPPEGEDDVVVDDEADAPGNPYTDVNQVNEVEGVTQKVLEENGVDLGTDFDVRSSFFSMRIVGETQSTRRDELYVVERVAGASPEEPIQGFRFLLRQERTDPLQEIAEEE